MKRSHFFLCIGATLMVLFIYIWIAPTTRPAESGGGLLRVTFLDVGQGDAALIESASGTQVLIDGGPDGSVLRQLGDTMGAFDRDIDMVVATHPDQDHIGGLVDVLDRYEVHTILMTENKSDAPVASAFLKRVETEGSTVIMARRGQIFDLGRGAEGSTTLAVLFPDRDPSGLESNTSSIVTKLSYGASDFLFTGDAPISIEEYLVALGGASLQSEVLKVGHHGSNTSSAETFVTAVHPTYAIISSGKDNRYGHPHKEVIDRLAEFAVTTKNTADVGSVFMVSDGNEIWFR